MVDDLDDSEQFDWDPSPEEIAEIERSIQDMNDGFGYEWLNDAEGVMVFKCLKCGRTADMHERPFPHKYDCPMRDKVQS